MRRRLLVATAGLAVSVLACDAHAQTAAPPDKEDKRVEALSHEVEELKALVHHLQDQILRVLPAEGGVPEGEVQALKDEIRDLRDQLAAARQTPPEPAAPQTAEAPEETGKQPKVVADVLRGLTINAMFDGYYEYNFDIPIGRVNSLRAYDVSSNSFSINQADLMIESAPDPGNGKRYGMRVDFQYGQATSSTQGNLANELRPDVYRNLYQAYGTYVFPLGDGLTVDFGKWASSLGYEGNYTKDQINYSRSYWFNYLPFYHTGLRAKYAVNDELALNLWITNGTQQTETFNNFKDQMYGLVYTPTPALSWTFNYYRGQEHPDVVYLQNPTPAQQAALPNLQGTYIQPITAPADGLLNILDSYATWQVSPELLLGAEADYVEQKLYSYSPALHVYGGAAYASYQFSPKFAVSARAEYLADHGGLFSGAAQDLKEGTLTFDYRVADGFLLRSEFRRDWSNRPYFLTHDLGVLTRDQPTVGLGLVWWLGQKEGAW